MALAVVAREKMIMGQFRRLTGAKIHPHKTAQVPHRIRFQADLVLEVAVGRLTRLF